MGVALERQVGEFLLRNILGQVALQSFLNYQDARLAAGDENAVDDDYKLKLQEKGWRAKCYVESRDRRLSACLTLYTSAPLQRVLLHIQHKDFVGFQGLCSVSTVCVGFRPVAKLDLFVGLQ